MKRRSLLSLWPDRDKINSPGKTRAALDRHSSTCQRLPSFAYAKLNEKIVVKKIVFNDSTSRQLEGILLIIH